MAKNWQRQNLSGGGHETVGIWWYDPSEQLRYLYGKVIKRFDTAKLSDERVKENEMQTERQSGISRVIQVIQGGNYAVFSYLRPENDKDIALYSRILSRFIFKEWVPVNRKITNTLGFTYEVFDEDRVYIYLPMQPGMESASELERSETMISKWARYIDDHIRDDLTTEALAYMAGYSTDNYRDVFQLYYGLTPSEYVRARRNFLSSGSEPRPFDEPEDSHIKIDIRTISSKTVILNEITSSKDKTIRNDILGLVSYWFTHDFDEMSRIKGKLAMTQDTYDKIYIWGSEPGYSNGKPEYKYYVGCILTEGKDVSSVENIHIETIPSGRYAVFSRDSGSDVVDLEDAFVLLHRYAFGTWIQKHRARADLTRRTFVIWKAKKLFFYVPVVG